MADLLKRIEILEEKLKKKFQDEPPFDTEEKQELFDNLKGEFYTVEHRLPIVCYENHYYLFLTHILLLIEIRKEKHIPLRWNILNNARSNNTYWYRDADLLKFLSIVQVVSLEHTLSHSLGIITKNMSKRKVFLIKLDYQPSYSIDIIKVQPLVKVGEKTMLLEEYIKIIEKKLYSKSIPAGVSLTYKVDVNIPSTTIKWKKLVIEGRDLWKDCCYDEEHKFILIKRIEYFDNFIKETIKKDLQIKFISTKYSYSHWLSISGLVNTQLCNYWNKVNHLISNKNFQNSFLLTQLVGNYSTNILTLESHKSNLQIVLGFFIGLYYNYEHIDSQIEPDLYSIFLMPSFSTLLDIFLSYGTHERKNKSSTSEKRIGACLFFLSGFVLNSLKTFQIRDTIDNLMGKRNLLLRDARRLQRIKSGMTSVLSDKAPEMWKLKEVANSHHKYIIDSHEITLDDLRQALFLGFASRCYAFRPYHYLGMQWGRNVNTMVSYTYYKTREKDVEKDTLLWAKKFVENSLKNNKSEKLCVGFNQLSGHVEHKRSKQNAVFLEFYFQMSIVLHDVACRWLLLDCDLRPKERDYLNWYLGERRKDFTNLERMYVKMEGKPCNPVDLIANYKKNEYIFGTPNSKNRKYLTTLYRKSFENSQMYTIRHLRHMTIEYISEMGISDKAREFLCNTWWVHSLETNTRVYDQSNLFMKSVGLKKALDSGFSSKEMIQAVNSEIQNEVIIPNTNSFDVFEKTVRQILNENKEVWDAVGEHTLIQCRIELVDFEVDDFDDVEIPFTIVQSIPIGYQTDETSWLLSDLLKVILCNLRLEGRVSKVSKYLDFLSPLLDENALDEYEQTSEWQNRCNLLEQRERKRLKT